MDTTTNNLLEDSHKGSNRADFLSMLDENERDDANNLLKLIDAPDDLRGIVPVLELVNKTLADEVKRLSSEQDYNDCKVLYTASSIAGKVKKSIEQDGKHLEWLKPVESLYGLCNKNPIYAIFSAYPDLIGSEEKKCLYLASLFIKYWRNYENLSDEQRALLGLSYRAIFENDKILIIDKIPAKAGSVDVLAVEIEKVFTTKKIDSSTTLGRYLHHLMMLFQNKMHKSDDEMGRGRSRKGGNGIIRGEIRSTTLTDIDGIERDPDDPGGVADYQCVASSLLPKKEQKEAETRCLSKNELLDSPELVEELLDQKFERHPDVEQDLVRKHYHSQDISSAIAANNQHLSTDWGRLTRYELYILIKEITLLSNSEEEKYQDIENLQIASVLVASFIFSLSIEDVLDLQLVGENSQTNGNTITLGYKKGKAIAVRHLRAIRPEQGRGPDPEGGHANVRKVVDEYMLNAPSWAAEILYRLKKAKGKKALDGFGIDLSKKKTIEYCRQWCSQLGQRYPGTRVTVKRVEDYLFRRALENPKIDLVESAIIFGRYHVLMDTALHYTAVPILRLQMRYTSLCGLIAREIQQEKQASNDDSWEFINTGSGQSQTLSLEFDESYAGSKLVPETRDVKHLVSALKNQLRYMGRKIKTVDDVVDYHNIYTLYTLEKFLFGTGYRAVRHTLPDPRLLDPKTGILTISDKDSNDSYHTRMVAVPSVVCQQIEYYLDHLKSLKRYMFSANHDLYEHLCDQIDQWLTIPRLIQRKGRLDKNERSSPFFIINKESAAVEVLRPGVVEKILRPVYGHKSNANRHYVRSYLVDTGCQKDITDTFIGHWIRGREPWSQYSTLSPLSFSETCIDYCGGLLKSDGWIAIRSKLS